LNRTAFSICKFQEIAVVFDLSSVLTPENCERQQMEIVLK
jgi:hypothetical protein